MSDVSSPVPGHSRRRRSTATFRAGYFTALEDAIRIVRRHLPASQTEHCEHQIRALQPRKVPPAQKGGFAQ